MPRATLFEEHASVLPHWVAQGVRGATVVCLDAHLDLQFIADEKIARLRACADGGAVAALESPHPLSPRRDACYGIEDWLYAAARLGVLARLVWVAPPHVLADLDTPLGALRQMEGVTEADLASFHRTAGGWIAGRLLGVELVAGELEVVAGLPLSGPLQVDIDAAYFVQVPGDRLWVQPDVVVARLRDWLGEDRPLTVARSLSSGFLPAAQQALAERVAALWEGRVELPGSPTLDKASELFRRLCEVRARALPLDLARLAALQREVRALDADAHLQSCAWIALGLLHAEFGDAAAAADCDARALALAGSHPELALQIGRLEWATGHPRAAWSWLSRAAVDDETRVAAWYLLAQCAEALGEPALALQWAQRANAAAPAWSECAALHARLAGPPASPRYDGGLPARSSVG